ncbi:GPO family capsid scaffolding protein [Escherichia coli]|uniref:GPO family capsid scaffolding protein n=1 Tax=Escherichia coli TaxID=562 RepID=UPI000370FE9C|nr:GPO family capsid scaffolding protein [Escherichia coli]
MAKKVSKFFRIGVEGDTCDGRVISAQDIQEMAETFDPRVYGCRINLEHLRGILPDGIFKRYGDVAELKAEKIDDDSALKGKWALFAKITPTDDLIAMNKAAQKVYTSMEIQPNFANTGKCYLVGLAVTDDPASLGTEYLQFCSRVQQNPLAGKKDQPGDLFSVATLAELEFEDLPDNLLTKISDTVKGIFSRKQADDDARFGDVHEAVTAIAVQVQTGGESAEVRFSQLESDVATVKKALNEQAAATTQQFSTIKNTLENTEDKTQPRRKLSAGGDGDSAGSTLTDC